MARVALVEETDHPELAERIAVLKHGRRGRLINVYRLLLHSPDLAIAWFGLLNAVRFGTALSDLVREIVIVRIAYLNAAAYVLAQHVPKLACEAGLTLAQCEHLRDWRASASFDEAQRAVLAYTDAMTTGIRVPADVYAEVARHYGEREIVELTVLVGAYNMHTRVMEALEIDLEASRGADDDRDA
jgi:alkylhydroperoxidase family enzyme